MNKTQPSGQDLEQQLNNILDFVTQPTNHSAENKSDVSEQTTLNKALYYLKHNQAPIEQNQLVLKHNQSTYWS